MTRNFGLGVVAVVALGACSSNTAPPPPTNPPAPTAAPSAASPDAPPTYPPDTYADLTAALDAIIPDDARVVGFGELHARVDRAQVKSALSYFTTAIATIGDELSDLVVETFIVDPKCGQQAKTTTKAMETEVKRPVETKSEVALLADAAKAKGIQPHAMTLTCADYKTLAPNGQIDPLAMLTITTRELRRIATSAVNYRNKTPDPQRTIVAVYGGALHNDRFPDPGVAEWSYAADIDKLTGNHFVEVDIIVPELAADDPTSQRQPWFPVVQAALAPNAHGRIAVFTRGERSFVVVLPAAAAK